jgi:hypothetical protein
MFISIIIMLVLMFCIITIDIHNDEMCEVHMHQWHNTNDVFEHMISMFSMQHNTNEEAHVSSTQAAHTPQPTDEEEAHYTAWHEEMAKKMLVYGVWAHDIYINRVGVVYGLTDPADLDPRKQPTMSNKVDMDEGTHVLTLGARAITWACNKVAHMNKVMNDELREIERDAQEATRGIAQDLKHMVQQVVYEYRASMARDITPTKHTKVRPTVGGKDTPQLLPAVYEHQVGGGS